MCHSSDFRSKIAPAVKLDGRKVRQKTSTVASCEIARLPHGEGICVKLLQHRCAVSYQCAAIRWCVCRKQAHLWLLIYTANDACQWVFMTVVRLRLHEDAHRLSINQDARYCFEFQNRNISFTIFCLNVRPVFCLTCSSSRWFRFLRSWVY